MNLELRPSPWWLRAGFVLISLGAWFWTQSLIGARSSPPGTMGDGMHDLLAAPNQYLHGHPAAANALLIASSAIIDCLGVFLLARSVFGPTLRPFLALLLLFAMRQICQLMCSLDPPEGMIWHDPGFPSLLVTYDVATDFFFSGHTGLAVMGAVELWRTGIRRWKILGIAIVIFEATTVLVLRAHYSMDVFTGAVAARYATILAARIAPSCDACLGSLASRK